MSGHEGFSGTGQTYSHTDGDKDATEAHEHTGSHSDGQVIPGNGERVVIGEGDQEHSENEELKNGSIEGLSDTIVLGLKLADQEVLSGNDCGAT